MKVKWVIENFTDSEDYRSLIQAVRDSGRYCFVIGRHNHFDFDPSGFEENDCVIVQGSIQMTKNIAERLPKGCFPIRYSSWEKYLCSSYYPHFQSFLFNDLHEITTLANLKANKFEYYRRFGRECLIFVRPDSGEKTFQAQLIDIQDFDKFWDNATSGGGNMTETDLVVVSTPKKINGEYRIVCSKYNGGEIITASTYQYQGKSTLIPSVPPKALEKCKEILAVGKHPDSLFCVDIAEDADGNCWLLELTSFSSAGLYLTDKVKLVNRVNEIVEEEYRIEKYTIESPLKPGAAKKLGLDKVNVLDVILKGIDEGHPY